MARRGRPLNTVTPYSRDYRRPRRFGMGQPPRRPKGRWARAIQRILDPLFYLRAVIVLASGALIALPLGADAVNLALHAVKAEGGDCRILSVIDGDTLSMWCPTGGARRVRLEGFDAPELFSPQCLSELVAAQAASWALRGRIFAADRIEARFDGTDRYGRDLATVALDGVPVARTMIAAGHGRAYGGERRRGWCAPG